MQEGPIKCLKKNHFNNSSPEVKKNCSYDRSHRSSFMNYISSSLPDQIRVEQALRIQVILFNVFKVFVGTYF